MGRHRYASGPTLRFPECNPDVMVTLHDSLLSSSARSLSLRRRPDLIAPPALPGTQLLDVKDPVGLNYFRFQEEEYALLTGWTAMISLTS